jgi:hypothetical protein
MNAKKMETLIQKGKIKVTSNNPNTIVIKERIIPVMIKHKVVKPPTSSAQMDTLVRAIGDYFRKRR